MKVNVKHALKTDVASAFKLCTEQKSQEAIYAVYVLTVNFSGMTPHVGQLLELRVENNNINTEVDRIKLPSIPSANFSLQIVGLQLNAEYNVDFYADVNGNGLYNAPPTDHAWRITFTNTTGDVVQAFSHNPSFTEINWKYHLTVNLFLMTLHLGELFELRESGRITRLKLEEYLCQLFWFLISQFISHSLN